MSDPAAAPPANIVVDLTNLWGMIICAVFIATAFYGASCLQVLMYFTTYGSDSWILKTLVVCLWLMGTLHEIFCIKGLWTLLIPNYGDLVVIGSIPPELLEQLLVTGIVEVLAQGFFTWRIWRFSNRNWIFPAILLPPIIAQFVATSVYTAKGLGKPEAYLATPEMSNLAYGINGTVAVIDVIITVTMCILLWKGRSGIKASDRIIVRLMNASMATGAWTAVFALWAVIGLAAWPNLLVYTLGYYPLCSLYCNAVLASLNSRKFMQRGISPVVMSSGPSSNGLPLTPMATSSLPRFGRGGRGKVDTEDDLATYPGRSMAVQIETTREFDYHNGASTVGSRDDDKV